jgi:ubiquinol-cytochrome c reductase iron-sulfur subunit
MTRPRLEKSGRSVLRKKGDEVTETVVTASDGGEQPTRRDFIHIAAGAVAIGGVAAVVWPLIDQMNPAADTLALSSIEFDVTKVTEGQQVVIKWRGKPLFIRNRTAKEIAEARDPKLKMSDLRDPQTDQERVKPGHDQYLVVIGVCTHLGCVPTFGTGDYGGWFCPCHGSQYDTSGRIRKGPAPLNLAVPDYTYLTPTRVKVG